MEHKRPNILICGTPGTGKSVLSSTLCERCSLHHIDVSEFVKKNSLFEEFDEEFQTYIVDEDKVSTLLSDFHPSRSILI
jgi:adenylate kinase